MISVHADVESRSLLDIGDYGAYRYWEDASTEVLMVAYRVNDGDLQLWDHGQPQPEDLRAAIAGGCVLVAHNAEFEMLAFDWLARNQGWTVPTKYRCTAAMAAALALPRDLESLGEVLGLDVLKDAAGKKLIRLFSVPNKHGTFNDPADYPDAYDQFRAYCKRDVETEEAAERRMLPLSDAEETIYRLNLEINRRGLRIDVRSAEAALSIAGSSKHIFDHQMAEATDGYVKKCSQSVRLKAWINAQGVDVASTTKADLLSLLETDVAFHVKQAIQLRLAAGKTSVSKLQTMLRRASPIDDRVRGAFIYHVASTGRFQSTGVNFANLPRPRKAFEAEQLHVRPARLFSAIRSGDPRMLDLMYGPDLGNPMHLLSDSIRGFIWAAPGKKLVVADYAGIEGAVIAWLAGENWKLEAMREIIADPDKPDLYQRTAAEIMGLPVSEIGKKHPFRQSIGKVSELALGFGGSVGAFSSMARGYQVDLDELYEPVMERSDPIDVEAARKRYEAALSRREKTTTVLSERAWLASMLVTRAWRASNSAIKQFWWDLEEGVRLAVREPGLTTTVGKVQYRNTHGYLFCRLPSGRCLAYASPKLKAQVYASRLIDGVWAEPEVMESDGAERLALAGRCRIERKSFPKVTALGVDGTTRQFVRFGLYGGLLAENCLAGNTEVLTRSGWKRITQVRLSDQLWDGCEWVDHDGLIRQGRRRTIELAGLRLTPEHKVLTDDGWTEAKELASASSRDGPDRAAFQPTNRAELRGIGRQERVVAGSVLMRHREAIRWGGARQRQNRKLRLPAKRNGAQTPANTWSVEPSALCRVAQHARSLPAGEPRSLRPLWGQRHHSMRALEHVPAILGRPGADVATRTDPGPSGQQRWVQPGELRLERLARAEPQQTEQHDNQHSGGANAAVRSSRAQRFKSDDYRLPATTQLANRASVRHAGFSPADHELVYDLVNAGPRHRFTARGPGGPALIVSNCTQAAARDILVNGLHLAEAAGYAVIGHVYDEIITEVDRGFGSPEEFSALICQLPDWAAGLPLTAGGYQSKRYRKD